MQKMFRITINRRLMAPHYIVTACWERIPVHQQARFVRQEQA